MSESRKKPGAGFWATIATTAVLAYPISMGPACWISSHIGRGAEIVSLAYSPIIRICNNGPETIDKCGIWYSEFGAAKHWTWQDWTWVRQSLNVNRGEYHDEWEAAGSRVNAE